MNKVVKENNKRLEVLYNESHKWLVAVSFNMTKDKDAAEELVSELYLYLGEKCNPSLWFSKSFNLMYCHSFLKSRFLNKIKSDKRKTEFTADCDGEDSDYDYEWDERIEKAYENVVGELKNMEVTKMWTCSRLYQLYAFNKEMTLEKLASEIGISKSTAFLQTKKAKTHLKNKIDNPFRSKS